MSKIAEAKESLQNHGLGRLFREAIEFALLRSPISTIISKQIYWKIAPIYYRKRWCLTNQNKFNAPLDPFKIFWISPNDIVEFSTRSYPQDYNAQKLFGSVKAGNWDYSREIETRPNYDGTPAYLYHADRFEDTIIHRSLSKHFIDGEDWEDTRIYSEAVDLIEAGSRLWRDCESKSEVMDRCDEIDELYELIRCEGYQTQFELIRRGKTRHVGFLDALANEILVDIGRDGDLLFANARHRLSIAKILDIDKIPVVVLVRHEEWMNKRDNVYSGEMSVNHPDTDELLCDSNF